MPQRYFRVPPTQGLLASTTFIPSPSYSEVIPCPYLGIILRTQSAVVTQSYWSLQPLLSLKYDTSFHNHFTIFQLTLTRLLTSSLMWYCSLSACQLQILTGYRSTSVGVFVPQIASRLELILIKQSCLLLARILLDLFRFHLTASTFLLPFHS